MLDVDLIGKRIREQRRARGLTQGEFAKELCVSFQAVSNWERGIAPPELENLIRIAAYFDVLVDELLRSVPERLVLGIDGGGTKTEFVVATREGQVQKRYLRTGSNPNDIGIQGATALLCDGIKDALMDFPSIDSVFCGIAGASTGDHIRHLTRHLKERYPTLKIEVNTDSANLFAMDDAADMVMISGTGSVVFVRRGEKCIRIGGWGYLLDVGGSAYDVGLGVIRTALGEEDSLQPPSLMSIMLKKRLGCTCTWEAVNHIYTEGKPFIASLAEVAFAAYREGDPKAIALIDETAKRLGELLNVGIKEYGAHPRAVAGGGLFEHYWEIMKAHLANYTETELISTGLPPVFGACRKALSLSGEAAADTFYENFKSSYGGVR